MADNKPSGRTAVDITPRLIPNEKLMPRDNSGGAGFDEYNAEFGDGGRVTKPKSYLSAGKG